MCFPFCFDCQEAWTQNGSLTLLILKVEIVISVYKLSPDLSLFCFHFSHWCLDFHFISMSQILSGRGKKKPTTKDLFQKERNSINVSIIHRNTAIWDPTILQTSWSNCYSCCFLQHQKWYLKPQSTQKWMFQMPFVILRDGAVIHPSWPTQLPLSLPALYHWEIFHPLPMNCRDWGSRTVHVDTNTEGRCSKPIPLLFKQPD